MPVEYFPLEDRVRLSSALDAASNACLQEAAASPQAERAEALLNKAARLAPDSLAIDVARYKFYFYRGQLSAAETIVRSSLARAATQGDFEADWCRHRGPLAARQVASGAQRHYLYALKALAFICLRRAALDEALSILDALQRLDPDDLVGAGVVRELAAGLLDAGDAG